MNKVHGRENDSVEVVDDVPKSDVALREETMLAFWREHEIFKKSVETPAGSEPVGEFIFYDGPPFATGLPHYGHILAGTIKDAIPRFWTMNGYRVERKWGWDCHGLPLENLIEKELGLGTKRDIEEYGVKNFNEKARSAVMRYADDWREIIPRMGRFVDMSSDYKTMDSSYTESVWWVFKSLHEKGLVYEGFKSMHLCPRCGTTLSNFEVNQGYKDIKDIAVTVKLPLLDDAGNVTDTSLLVWTTTPWTLPGNMAAAVHNDLEYVKVNVDGEHYILAKGRLAQLGDIAHEVLEEMKGSDLVGKKYQPPFAYMQSQVTEDLENAWTIYHADYVELGEEGTGAVHIAPAYGDDDMKLAQEHIVPIVHHVDNTGHFMPFVTDFAGRLVKPKDDEKAEVDHKDTDIEILRALQATGKIFKKENITHSYPHCWRCDTPLLNYATTSWFVNVPSMKDQLIEANNKVKWVPEHVGTNRFGKWLEGARDWAISRQRYWGAPLPIWRNPETKEVKIFGSLEELKHYVPKSGNTYSLMRHGESEYNLKRLLNCDIAIDNPLTENGREQVRVSAAALTDVDIIVRSPLMRAKQTAEIVAEVLGIAPEAIVEDNRLLELGMGEFEGKTIEEKNSTFACLEDKFTISMHGTETLNQLRTRVGLLLEEYEAAYKGKRILFVGHGDTLWMMEAVMQGASIAEAIKLGERYIQNGEVREVPYVPFPHNDYFELDFHRPYIDDVVLEENGVRLERVPDVFDCWFESGSMPYAQHHYMGGNPEDFQKNCFPAQFIAEGLDQTRGWFYSLLVLGTALFGKSPFENVIVNGLVLAEDGKKMSKKLQNYPDPMDLVARVGADSMRFYLLASPVIKGEDLNFAEKEVLELQRKNLGRLHNVLAMYEMFKDGTTSRSDSPNVLDKWIVARLQEVINETTAGYKSYELDKATRPVTDFIDDLSVWYLRRSRDRLKGEDQADKALALATLRYTLRTLALVMAPVMPFYAEYLWLAVKEEDDTESVHLGKWPNEESVDRDVIANMMNVRSFANIGLKLRTEKKLNLKQPLRSFFISHSFAKPNGWGVEHESILAEELNVKEVVLKPLEEKSCDFDWIIDEQLRDEGAVRELVRAVQSLRAKEDLIPTDKIIISASEKGDKLLHKAEHQEYIKKITGAVEIQLSQISDGLEVSTGPYAFFVAIKKL